MAEQETEHPQAAAPAEAIPASGKENVYVLKERYSIDFSTPMVWLDSNGGKAYKVEDKINDKRELFCSRLQQQNLTAQFFAALSQIH